ncbi:hypothetical protein [Nocardia sp. NPDC057668]|uniref:hypothetical protein n=1 Tax=Nocardia sp. NPDC057668 TaxID=3346202 RepID=UPI00366B7837
MWSWDEHQSIRATAAAWTPWRTTPPEPTVTDPDYRSEGSTLSPRAAGPRPPGPEQPSDMGAIEPAGDAEWPGDMPVGDSESRTERRRDVQGAEPSTRAERPAEVPANTVRRGAAVPGSRRAVPHSGGARPRSAGAVRRPATTGPRPGSRDKDDGAPAGDGGCAIRANTPVRAAAG